MQLVGFSLLDFLDPSSYCPSRQLQVNMSTPNSSVIFNSIPSEYPVVGETLKKVQGTIDLDAKLEQGSVLVKTKTLSLDP